jgi:NTE family protein
MRSRPPEPEEPPVGLVLSGGGARSSFQIGALRYLYDRVGITPGVITGTSAGAILGVVLAQSADRAGQRRSLGDLERLWGAMTQSSDMFAEEEWFADLRGRGAAGPWGPAAVVGSIAARQDLGRADADLERILRAARAARSMYRPGPIAGRILDPAVFDPRRVAGSGVRLRVAVVGLESGELRYVTESGALVSRRGEELEPAGTLDLADAVRASCAIPMVFPPVALAGEHYVDGGVREALPAEVAMSHLHAGTTYAVVAGARRLQREASFADRDMIAVLLRATAGIMADEVQRDEVAWAEQAGAVVVAPELDVHDTLTVTPGLLRIAMDYGYLRAAEVHAAADPAQRRLTREVVELRRQIWQTEERAFAPAAPLASAAADLGPLKTRLGGLLARVRPGLLPPGAQEWWRTWERHAFPVAAEPGWL